LAVVPVKGQHYNTPSQTTQTEEKKIQVAKSEKMEFAQKILFHETLLLFKRVQLSTDN